MGVLTGIVLLVTMGTLMYYRVTALISSIALAFTLILLSLFNFSLFVSIGWTLWILFTVLLLLAPLRRRLMTNPFMRWFRSQQPPLSTAEKIALEAGDVWWEGQFFSGSPDWQQLLQMPKPSLTDAEQAFLEGPVETLCSLLDDWEINNKNKELSDEAWNYIKKERFWGLEIDKAYGGHGFSPFGHSAVISKIASRSASAAIMVMVPNSVGPAEFLKRYGTQTQCDYYLPRLANGEEVACFALTASAAGSDATNMQDEGIVCYGEHQGEQVMGILLQWNKRYITLAPVATLIGLAFQLRDPEHLLGDQTDVGITFALVPARHPGVTTGRRHQPLDLGFMNGPTQGKDVFIPIDWIIGGVEQRGQGWHMMMESLAVGRGISLPSVAAAMAQKCFITTGAYARIREQFQRPIGDFEGVAEALGRIGGLTYISEATRLFNAMAVDQGARPAVAAAIAKYHLTEMVRRVVIDSMDVHGGRAIQNGPSNYLISVYQMAPIMVTVEGANILTRNLMIFGQGVMRCHPFLRDEIIAANNPDPVEASQQFDRLLWRHLGFIGHQCVRAVVYGITGGRWIRVSTSRVTRRYYQQLTRMSNALAVLTDLTLALLGNKLKIKESLSARLGDVLSHLYLASAVLKYFHDQGEPEADQVFVDWSVRYCLSEANRAINGLLSNFPIGWIGKLMSRVIFPWGKAYATPSDRSGFEIAKIMQQDSELRDRLASLCYIGDQAGAVGRVEFAFQAWLTVAPLCEKIKIALRKKELKRCGSWQETAAAAAKAGVLTEQEAAALIQAADECWQAIQVDVFDGK